MGKKNVYRAAPKKPRAAKLAWAAFTERSGEPCEMSFDLETRSWVATYPEKGKRCVIPEKDLV